MLVLRPDHLGDLALFSASLRHLRTFFPRATITLVAKAYGRELFAGSPYIDRHADWDSLSTLARRVNRYVPERPETVGRLVRRALFSRHRSDVLLLPVRSPNRSMHQVVRLLRATAKYGISGDTTCQLPEVDHASGHAYTDRLHLGAGDRFEHELDVNRAFLTWLGVDVAAGDYRPELPAHPTHRAAAVRAVRRADGGTVLGICPSGATTTLKNYPARAYTAALDALGVDPLHVVIFGDASGSGTCGELEHAIRSTGVAASVTNLCGRTSVPMLVEGLRACDAVLSIDAGPLHIAAALDRPTVGIVGGGFPNRFFPWGDPDRTRIAEHRLDCFGCGYQCPYETRRCVVELPPAAVARQLRVVLGVPTATKLTGA